MSEAGYIIVAWWSVVLVLAAAFRATRIELLKALAIGLACALVGALAIAGFVLVAAI